MIQPITERDLRELGKNSNSKGKLRVGLMQTKLQKRYSMNSYSEYRVTTKQFSGQEITEEDIQKAQELDKSV